MSVFLAVVVIVSSVVVLDVAALLWGKDSRDGPNSSEWERRRNWNGW